MKNEEIILKKMNEFYWPISTINKTISSLAWMFEEGNRYVSRIKKNASDGKSGKFPGNASLVVLEKERAYIQPLYGDDADEFCVEIDRQALIKLIDDWEELLKKQPEEIILIRDENGNVTIQEHAK